MYLQVRTQICAQPTVSLNPEAYLAPPNGSARPQKDMRCIHKENGGRFMKLKRLCEVKMKSYMQTMMVNMNYSVLAIICA